MSLYTLKVEEIKTIKEVNRYYNQASFALDQIVEEIIQSKGKNNKDLEEQATYLETLMDSLIRRKYELKRPSLSDGIIDLYQEKKYHYTICEHGNSIPIGKIEYREETKPIPGNISYRILDDYQGHHYALRALRLLGSLLQQNGIEKIFITASTSFNIPSIKTIEQFGGTPYPLEKKNNGPVPYTCDLKKIYAK